MQRIKSLQMSYLKKAGFLELEVSELSNSYTMRELRHIPYLAKLIRSRRLYRDSLAKRGATGTQVDAAVVGLYIKNDWRAVDGSYSVWGLVRKYRKLTIEEGDYIPPKRKSSHHAVGVSREAVDGQKVRRGNTMLDKYEHGRHKGY